MECDAMDICRGTNVYEKEWEQLTREKAFEGYMPERVCISLMQDYQIICRPTVCHGEFVCRGQVIGEPEGTEGTCVHASISGHVEEIFHVQRAPGVLEPYVCIRREQGKTAEWRPFAMDFGKEALFQAMYRIGLARERFSKARVLVVNGFANEPYITSSYRLMMESPGKIILGAILGAAAAEAEMIYICVNEDAFDAVARMRRAVSKYGGNMGNRRTIRVVPIKHRYPKGNEKILLKEVFGREKKTAAVVTLSEMAALYDGIYDGEPWTKIGITVSGEVPNPKNLWVPVGTNIQDIINYCGGKNEEAVIIQGGPLSGMVVDGPNAWVGRETCGLLVLRPPERVDGPCVHCGQCRDVCPQGLMPDRIEALYLSGEEVPQSYGAESCIGCGLCSYICPSGRRLTEYMGQVKKGRKKANREAKRLSQDSDYIDIPVKLRLMGGLGAMEIKSQSPPHIHRRGTIHDVMLQSMTGLLPLIAGALYIYPGHRIHLLLMLLVGSISAILSEYFWQMFRNEYLSIRDYSACFGGLLLPLLFPIDTPLWKISLAAALSILIGKQLFGGIGRSPIHPVLVGKLLFMPYGIPLIEGLWPLALLAPAWMILKRMNPPAYSLAFLALLWAGNPENITSATIYLAAAYFIHSYERMPPSRAGRWIFTLAAAGLTLCFQMMGMGPASVFFAVGCMDLTVPLLEFPSVKRI